MIDTYSILEQIKERLEQDITDLAVDFAPDNPVEANFIHPRGKVFISYEGSNASEPTGNSQSVNHNFATFTGLKSSVKLKDRLKYLDSIRQSITGNLFINGYYLYWTNTSVVGEDENVWYYETTFVLPGIGYIGE